MSEGLIAELWYDRQPIRHAHIREEHAKGLVRLRTNWISLGYQRQRYHSFVWVVRRPDGSVFDRRDVGPWTFSYPVSDDEELLRRKRHFEERLGGKWPFDCMYRRFGFDIFQVIYSEEMPESRYAELLADSDQRMVKTDRWWYRALEEHKLHVKETS